MGSVNRISPLILRKIHFRAIISCDSFGRDRMSGWPSGLRRQTQEVDSSLLLSVLVHECGRGFESHF